MLWDTWKKGFDAWENKTAALLEQMLKSSVVLQPMGMMMSQAMKAKAASDKAVAQWWSMIGLPTRRDQEKSLHALNQLQSRIHDLEEQLEQLKGSNKN
jgi:TolA-binding protein